MSAIGIVGFGRFGHALGELFQAAGYSVRAFDPTAQVPDAIRVSDLDTLTAMVSDVFVAVPVATMPATFADLSTILTSDHIVIDVGSVKLGPSRQMAETLRTPWVASHPLFGPISLARAEPGLRAVICPNGLYPEAEARVAALYRSVGCTVIELDAETHDRIMAQTHALAFFIAKGMLDAGVPTDSEAAPPSFQAMARTIESVRGDAGHLLATLHRENPFAADERRRILATLAELDHKLNAAGQVPEGPSLTIQTSQTPPELKETRSLIDEVDADILQLLARRAELSRRARQAKAAVGRSIVDPVREAEMLERRESWAADAGLDPVHARAVFEAIVAMSSALQIREV